MSVAEEGAPILILGAGPTGLGAAWRLSQQSGREAESFLLLDQSSEVGGTAGSWTTPEGFTFDYGGHVLFPHAEYQLFVELLDRVVPDWFSSLPVRGVWVHKASIPTPVQRNIHRLPLRQMVACLNSLYRARRSGRVEERDTTLDIHLRQQFGPVLADAVMIPLNRKMWATEPRDMGTSWTGHRSGTKERNVASVRIRDVVRNWLLQRDSPSWTPDTRVRYPASGGSGTIWSRVGALIPSENKRLGLRVVQVHGGKREITLNDGSTLKYQHLINTMPLDTLLKMMVDQQGLAEKSARLRAARVQIFGYGLRGPVPASLQGHHAVSIPSAKVPMWRINLPANFAPGNAPEGHWSLLCECSLEPETSTLYSSAQIEEALRSEGFVLPTTEIVSRSERTFEHGYPVPFAGRDPLINEIQGTLEPLGIYSRGRFGGWRYEVSNQDHGFMQGVEVIDRILLGVPEYTYKKTW